MQISSIREVIVFEKKIVKKFLKYVEVLRDKKSDKLSKQLKDKNHWEKFSLNNLGPDGYGLFLKFVNLNLKS